MEFEGKDDKIDKAQENKQKKATPSATDDGFMMNTTEVKESYPFQTDYPAYYEGVANFESSAKDNFQSSVGQYPPQKGAANKGETKTKPEQVAQKEKQKQKKDPPTAKDLIKLYKKKPGILAASVIPRIQGEPNLLVDLIYGLIGNNRDKFLIALTNKMDLGALFKVSRGLLIIMNDEIGGVYAYTDEGKTAKLILNAVLRKKNKVEEQSQAKNLAPKKESAREVYEKNKGEFYTLAHLVAHRIPYDQDFTVELIYLIPYGQRDNFCIKLAEAMTEILLAITPRSTLKIIRNQIDDIFSLDQDSREYISLIDGYINEQSDAIKMDYRSMAMRLKKELIKPANQQNAEVISQIIKQINFDQSAQQKLRMVYEGSLMADLNDPWTHYFMIETPSVENEENSYSMPNEMLKGWLVLEHAKSSPTGFSYSYYLNDKEGLRTVCTRYKLKQSELESLNKWVSVGDKISVEGSKPRFLMSGEKIKIPATLYISQIETFLIKGEDGKYSDGKVQQSIENEVQTIDLESMAKAMHELLSVRYVQDKAPQMLQVLSDLNHNPIQIRALKVMYKNTYGKSLKDEIKDKFTIQQLARNGAGAAEFSITPVECDFTDRDSVLSMLKGVETQEVRAQRIINKIQAELGKGLSVKLWTGLTIAELVDRAHEALSPALSKDPKEVNHVKLLSALASLRSRKTNIDAFLQNYELKYGDFWNAIEKAKASNRMSLNALDDNLWGAKYKVGGDGINITSSTIDAVKAYLTVRVLPNDGSVDVFMGESPRYQLKSGGTAEQRLSDKFEKGSLIRYKPKEEADDVIYYIVEDNDFLASIAQKFGVSLSILIEYNKTALEEAKRKAGKGKLGDHIGAGQVIKMPSGVLKGRDFYEVIGSRVIQESIDLYDFKHVDGASYRIDGTAYKPSMIEDLINAGLFQDPTGVASFSFDLEVYLKLELAVIFSVKVGLGGEVSAAMNDSRALEITSRAEARTSAGIDIGKFNAEMKKNWAIMGSTNVFFGVKHYAAKFNHDVYTFLLNHNQFIPEFAEYWGDDEVMDNLSKEYFQKTTLNARSAGYGKSKSNSKKVNYKKIGTPKYAGDNEEGKALQPSEDYIKKKDLEESEGNFTYEDESILLDTGFMQVSSLLSKHDVNKDNEGLWTHIKFNLTVKNIEKLIATLGKGAGQSATDIIKSPKGIEMFVKDLRGAAEGLSLLFGGSNIGKTVKGSGFKQALAKKHAATIGDKPKIDDSGKAKSSWSADGGIVVDVCFQYDEDDKKWYFQYVRALAKVETKFEKEKTLASYYGVANLKGGVKIETDYEGSLMEIPGSNSISYISTVYNGFMRQSDPSDEVLFREAAFAEAQKSRLNGDLDKEQEIINKYWASYTERKTNHHTIYYTNALWNDYRDANTKVLEKMFENFLTPIIKAYKNHTSEESLEWGDIDDLKFIDAAQAKEFLGRNPEFALTDKENGFGCVDIESISTERKSKELDLFERFVLFNLYKEHQKHEFDYFYYQKE